MMQLQSARACQQQSSTTTTTQASLALLAGANFVGMLFTFLLPETNGAAPHAAWLAAPPPCQRDQQLLMLLRYHHRPSW